jgi:hypothetical protein
MVNATNRARRAIPTVTVAVTVLTILFFWFGTGSQESGFVQRFGLL